MIGSPPPTRGKGETLERGYMSIGITPAYAGKSFSRPLTPCMIWDHPRLRGEKSITPPSYTLYLGSPPPTRGKVPSGFLISTALRITPAYAGKSHFIGVFDFAIGDHPRLRGEKPFPSPSLLTRIGSPPPTRGKVRRVRCFCHAVRITPAYAGKSPVGAMLSPP